MPRKVVPPRIEPEEHAACNGFLLSFRDALEIVGGKWKSLVLLSLGFKGTMRFGELQRLHQGIPAKTLSKELKELEMNGLVQRTVLDTMPVTVTYTITPYGRTLEKVLKDLRLWGVQHRERIRSNGPVKKRGAAVRGGRMKVVG
jgi:DNA-binding HxlR family transcriptional regulator